MTRGVRWNRTGLRHASRGARRAVGCTPTGVVRAALVASVVAIGCAMPPPDDSKAMEARVVRSKLASGLDLYEAGDYAIAAERFAEAAAGAQRCRDPEMERRARAAECAAWLRARRLGDFAACTASLEPLQRRARRSDAGVNTLVALGAIAGHRSTPVLRVPDGVAPVLRDVQQSMTRHGGS